MILFNCSEIQFLTNIIGYIFTIMQWVVPIFLVVLVSIDVAKIAINPDEKKKSEVMAKIGKRIMYAVILFLVPLLVRLIFSMLGNSFNFDNSWWGCINKALNR